MSRGVYFLSNDRILDLAVAFLNSFRRFNPDIPLCLIPYDADIRRLEGLRDRYGFTVYPDTESLAVCDGISRCFHGKRSREYRKFVMWEGIYDEFVYIDVDTIVLSGIDFAFDLLDEYEFVTSHSNMPGIARYVWKDSIKASGALTEEQIAFAANTGFIISKRGALTLEEVESRVGPALALAPHMELNSREQPFLNYLMVTSGKRYTSLFALKQSGSYPDLPREHWAGNEDGLVRDGQVFFRDDPTPVLLVHWAGQWKPTRWEKVVYHLFHKLGLRSVWDRPVMRSSMPCGELWRHYRFMGERVE